jgi:hypothetical protein
MPMVITSSTRREPAMCNIPAANYVNPNAALGDKLVTEEMDPNITPQQAAMQLRDQMIKQVKTMVMISLLKKQRETASVAAAAVPPELTGVSVQEELARMDVDVQGALRAFKGSPLDDVPTGDAGHPADAIVQWDLIDGKKVKDYKISLSEYLRNTYEASWSRTDVDPGWSDPDCIFEVRPDNCPPDRQWGNFFA